MGLLNLITPTAVSKRPDNDKITILIISIFSCFLMNTSANVNGYCDRGMSRVLLIFYIFFKIFFYGHILRAKCFAFSKKLFNEIDSKVPEIIS